MPRLWTAVIAIATAGAVLGSAPALAQASPSSDITTWTSSESGTPPNATYLISYDNKGTTLTVSGTAAGTGSVDIVCFYGSAPSFVTLATGVPVSGGQFNSGPHPLHTALPSTTLAGHACRLRAIPSGGGTADDTSQFAGPDIAVSEVALPSGALGGHGYDFSVVATTLAGSAAWDSAGSCGPYAAPFDSSFGQGNFAIDCTGSLLGANLPSGARRSEVQVDGNDAYDAASANALFGALGATSLNAGVTQDPTDGVMSSQSTEAWEVCDVPVAYGATCPLFTSAGVQLQRTITTSDGGLVVTMTDTWSSTDGQAHSLDLLYDDYVGLKSSGTLRGYEFPGQSSFSPYQAGATVPGPSAAPASILVRTNLAAADGTPTEAAGAITFSRAPAGFIFVSNNELEEHQVLDVPAGGSTSLSYIYSTGYTVAPVQALALAAQDEFEAPAIAITSLASGTTVSSPSLTLAGVADAGSGISSVSVAGQPVPVAPDGSWSAQVALNPGPNTITALATDGAGATVQTQVSVVYAPPSSPGAPVVCKVPRIKGMKLPAAERALRRAHCRVGRIKHEGSKQVRKGRAVGTRPRAGRRLGAGSKIELFVSTGP